MNLRQARDELAKRVENFIRNFETENEDIFVSGISIDRVMKTNCQGKENLNDLTALSIDLKVRQ